MSNLITSTQVENALANRVKSIGGDEKQFKKEISFAIQHVKKNNQLQKADHNSIMESILNVMQVGLSLNPVSKLGYLVPRWDRMTRSNVCAFEPSYQGYVKLLTDSGSVETVYSQLVYENDTFDVSYGTSTEINHKPTFKNRGEVIAVYAIGVLPSGLKVPEVMTIEEVNDIMEISESYKAFKADKIKSCIWVSNFGEMARKTVIRRIFKYLPKTESFNKMAMAVSLDESDYTATDEQLNYIESLLETSSIAMEKQFQIESEFNSYSSEAAQKCIYYLKQNQVDPIDSGGNYSQTDIKNKLKQLS